VPHSADENGIIAADMEYEQTNKQTNKRKTD